MKYIVVLIIFLSQLFSITADKLSKFIANPLYHFNNTQLAVTIVPFVKDDKTIKAIKVVDSIDDTIFFQAYKKDGELVYSKIPSNILKLHIEEANITYNSEVIGKLIIYREIKSLLTPKEKKWIKNHIVKIGVTNWSPIVFSTNKDIDGISGDFTKLIIKKTGLKIKIINEDWNKLLEQFKKNKIDVLPATFYTKDREEYGFFSKPYFQMKNFLFVKEDSDIKSFNDIKTLAIVKGYGTIEQIKTKFPTIKIVETKNLLDSINRVLDKKVDALYDGQLVVSQTLMKNLITGLKAIPQDVFPATNLYYYINKNEPILLSIIQKALNAITIEEKAQILSKWINSSYVINFTKKEKEWLSKNIQIKYTYDPDWKPIEWADDIKEQQGILRDILDLIIQRTGINIKVIYSKNWDDVLQNIENEKADAYATSLLDNPKLNYTKHSILKVPYVFLTRTDADYIENMDDIKDKKIGVFKNSSIHKILKKEYPNIKLIIFSKDIEGFKLLRQSKIDVALFNIITAKYYLNYLSMNKYIKINNKSKYMLNLKIAVNKKFGDIPISIIDKGLNSITKKEFNDIIDKWSNITKSTIITDWRVIVEITVGLLLLVLLMFFYNYKLNKKVKEKTLEIRNLLDIFDKNVIASRINENGIIEYVSDEFSKTSGYEKDELIGEKHTIIKHPDMPESIYEELWKTLKNGEIWRGEVKNIKKNGDTYWAEVVATPEFKNGKFIGYSDIRHDITAKKEVEALSKNLEKLIEDRTFDLLQAKKEIEIMHKHTKDSIELASLLQNSLLPKKEELVECFKDYFVLWKPKDIVGGDIYLFDKLRNENECLLMVIDCTGHGVPGAFVTMIVKAVEREIIARIKEDKTFEVSPSWVLGYFNKTIKKLLRQEEDSSVSNSGFDGGIIYYNKREQILKFSGAQTPLFYVKDGEVEIIKGDRYSVGYKNCDINYEYKEYSLEVKEGMKFYLSTDGYIDQNGGKYGFPLGKSKFIEIIQNNYNLPMIEQKNIFIKKLQEYQQQEEQSDDITVVGFEIDKKSDMSVILEYDGVLTQAIIAHHIDILEHNIKNMKILAKISTVVIELTQNMMNYSKTHEIGCRDIRPAGYLKVVQIGDKYMVESKNIVSIEDKEKIETVLSHILSLDYSAIKEEYRKLRKSGINKHKKGGGIGFYEIAKLSSNMIYYFEKINKDKYYFMLQVIIKDTKRV